MRLKYLILLLFVITLLTSHVEVLFFLFCMALLLLFIYKIPLHIFIKRVVLVLPFFFLLLCFRPSLFLVVGTKTVTAILFLAIITNNFSLTTLKKFMMTVGLPSYLQQITLLAVRYSHTFVDEIKKSHLSLKLRGAFHRRHFWQANFIGTLVGHFFLRSVMRSKSVYQAMKLRGY